MQVRNIYDAKTHFSRLIEYALQGEEVIISKAGIPLIRLVPYQPEFKTRKPGYWRGKVTIADDFDELPEDLIKAFAGHLE